MNKFFDWFVESFQLLFDFLGNIINNTLTMLGVVSTLPKVILNLYGYLPSIITVCVSLVTAMSIIKTILGWGNQ